MRPPIVQIVFGDFGDKLTHGFGRLFLEFRLAFLDFVDELHDGGGDRAHPMVGEPHLCPARERGEGILNGVLVCGADVGEHLPHHVLFGEVRHGIDDQYVDGRLTHG